MPGVLRKAKRAPGPLELEFWMAGPKRHVYQTHINTWTRVQTKGRRGALRNSLQIRGSHLPKETRVVCRNKDGLAAVEKSPGSSPLCK